MRSADITKGVFGECRGKLAQKKTGRSIEENCEGKNLEGVKSLGINFSS